MAVREIGISSFVTRSIQYEGSVTVSILNIFSNVHVGWVSPVRFNPYGKSGSS